MDNQNVNLQVLRSPEPTAEAARKADERRRVAELERDIKELGSALEARDREVSIHSAKRTGDSQTRAMTPAAAVGDCAAPQPEQLSTPADMFSTPKGVSPRIWRFATIRAIQQQPKLDSKSGPSAGRRKLGRLRGVVIGVLSFMSGGALIHWAPAIGITQDMYRSAMAEMQRLTGGENSETDEAAGNAAEEKLVVAAAALRREEARQALEKATVEAERAMPAAQAGAAQETARPKAEADARIEEAEAHKVAESKPKSVAEVRENAERAEASLKLSEQDRKSVQVALNSLGHHIPTATGYFGPRTRRMIAAWQRREDYLKPVT